MRKDPHHSGRGTSQTEGPGAGREGLLVGIGRDRERGKAAGVCLVYGVHLSPVTRGLGG